jgi:hypothetical protein
MEAHRKARLARIKAAYEQAEAFLTTLESQHQVNHIAAAMLYLAEGAKSEGCFMFANSNPDVIRYWLYLLRNSFPIDESKFCLHIMARADQDGEELLQYWMEVTRINRSIKTHVDTRTEGKPTKRNDYKGVCKVVYHDVALRRYLDAVAQGLMVRAVGDAVPD